MIFTTQRIDWLDACDLYQDTQDVSTSEMLDAVLYITPEFPREFITEMYQLSDDWSDFTAVRPSDDCPF